MLKSRHKNSHDISYGIFRIFIPSDGTAPDRRFKNVAEKKKENKSFKLF